MSLQREIETYRSKLPELLAAHKGKWVVIFGDQVLGIRDTVDEAVALGYQDHLQEPFLVRQVLEEEPVLVATRDLRPCRT